MSWNPSEIVTPSAAAPLESESERLSVLENATVMLVDDETTVLDMVQLYLEDAGCSRFIVTSDSTDALELFRAHAPDVLLLDVVMPEVSGFDILTEIRADSNLTETPVVVLTSSTDPSTKLEALELGATDFLAKPVDPSELVLRLRNMLVVKDYHDRLAYFDMLTGLPNRRLFLRRLEGALSAASDAERQVALLHIGLDRFRQLNDTLGPAIGDSLLAQVARRLEHSVRGQHILPRTAAPDGGADFVARLGGDEFAGVLTNVSNLNEVTGVAKRLLDTIANPLTVNGEDYFLTASIGIVMLPDKGRDVDTALQRAAVATTQAKQEGGSVYQFYTDAINQRSTRRLSLESHLRKALDADQLELHYQPQVDVASGALLGAEALLRWQHPEFGYVSPMELIPIAEDTGLITPIGAWVLERACAQCASWQAAGVSEMRISVNVSAKQFQQRALLTTIRGAIDSSRLPGPSLMVELTESMVMENAEQSVTLLKELAGLGIGLSVDDFGTGYSSLSYLKRFPLDEVKIDRSFVKDIPNDEDDMALATAIIAMAHNLGLTVVAEGVEDEAQLGFLKRNACDHYQGYYFSKPITAAAFTRLLYDLNAVSNTGT